MKGRTFGIGLLAFTAIFAAALVWFQFFAFYERQQDVAEVAGVPVTAYEGIDARTSPLKLRGCFSAQVVDFEGFEPATNPTPLVAPFWFRCFDARTISADIRAGRAEARVLARDAPDGIDLHVALYPDGRGYLWRQLNERFTD